MTRFIFTVTAGRSGQNSLAALIEHSVANCHTGVEEPKIRPWTGGRLAAFERRFRRRFLETHELLGRGRTLKAYAAGDEVYLNRIARKRLHAIKRDLHRCQVSTYFDVSKYFGRGLHRGYLRALPRLSVVHLVRDPLKNMRSFLNRHKNFALDNAAPSSPGNLLRLSSDEWEKGELYLWAWCEMNLRYLEISAHPNTEIAVEIRTDDLYVPERMSARFDALGLSCRSPLVSAPLNTNAAAGHGPTAVTAEDVDIFRRFVRRIPPEVMERLTYLHSYDPQSAVTVD